MPTTTKMGIVYPSSTDLVKDGATAMGTISTTVDAKTGLVLISTTTIGSAVSSVSVDNCFSSTFDQYKIMIAFQSASTAQSLQMRLRVSNTDNSSSNYRWGSVERPSLNTTTGAFNGNTATSWALTTYGQETGIAEVTLNYPFAAFVPSMVVISGTSDNASNRSFTYLSGGSMTVSTSYTGFTIIPQSGTFTGGQITVYGVNK